MFESSEGQPGGGGEEPARSTDVGGEKSARLPDVGGGAPPWRQSPREEESPPRLREWIDTLIRSTGPSDDVARIDMLADLRELVCVAGGLTTTIVAEFARSQRRSTRLVDKRERIDASIAAQVGLARRESPYKGRRLVGLATVLTTEMPHIYTALRLGRISEWRATIIVRETACVSREDRGKIDARIGAEIDRFERLSDKKLEAEVQALAYQADKEVFVHAREQAVKDRRVSVRPLPGGMARISATVPLVQGVSVYATLLKVADAAKAAGDERSRGAIMVDTMLHRICIPANTAAPASASASAAPPALTAPSPSAPTSASAASAGWDAVTAPCAPTVPVGVLLVVSDATLFGGGDEPAQCGPFGPIPADLARELVVAADAEGLATLQRVYTTPTAVVGMDSRSRCFPAGLARLIRVRDRTCRMPYCDAPIRHIDHVTPAAAGGPTSYGNGQGLCEGCNHAKQPVGWTSRAVETMDGRHEVETTTPTGHAYRSTAPPQPRSAAECREPSLGKAG